MYSVPLKHQCGLSQHELSNVNTLPYAIGLVSPIFGAMGRFFGGRLSLFIGGVIVAASMSGQFALATHCDGAVRSAAPILLVLASCGTYTGLQFITAFAFPTPVLFWPRNRSQVTATAKSFVATGGAVIAQTYRLFYGVPTSSPTALNCMIMWAAASFGCATVAALAMPRPSRIPTASGSSGEAEEPRRALNFAFGEIALLGLFATVTPLVADGIAHDGLVFGMWLLTLLPIPIILITPSRWRAPSVASASINNPSSAFTTALLMPAAIDVPAAAAPSAAEPCTTAAEPTSLIQQSSRGGESSKQYTLCEMLCTLDCWLLWSVGVVVIGSGSMLATNLAFIIEAADAPTHLVTTTATTFATGNLLGRLLTPVAACVLVNRGWARPWLLLPSRSHASSQLALLWAGTGKASAALQQVLLVAARPPTAPLVQCGRCSSCFHRSYSAGSILYSTIYSTMVGARPLATSLSPICCHRLSTRTARPAAPANASGRNALRRRMRRLLECAGWPRFRPPCWRCVRAVCMAGSADVLDIGRQTYPKW